MCILKYILTPLIALWHVLLAGCYTVTLKRIAPPVEPTMFVQVFQTFSALNDFWLTTPSNPLEFLTDQSSFFSSIQISTFFCCNCIVFAVGGISMLRVQEYQGIKTHVMLGNDDFHRRMSRKCHTFQVVWKRNLVFCPSWKQCFIWLSINLYSNLSMSYKCPWKFLE